MEVASQVRAVLEENNSLLSRHKSQQRLVSELQAQLRRRGQRSVREWPGPSAQVSCTCAESTAEGELVQLEREKKGKELQLQQVMDGHAHLANQVSRLVGVAVGGANSTEHPDTLQRMAGSVSSLLCWGGHHGHSIPPSACWRGITAKALLQQQPSRTGLW